MRRFHIYRSYYFYFFDELDDRCKVSFGDISKDKKRRSVVIIIHLEES